jgi:hypothetical protein
MSSGSLRPTSAAYFRAPSMRDELRHVVDLHGARRLRVPERVERRPALRRFDRTPHRAGAVATDPDRRVRLLHGSGTHPHPTRGEVPTLVPDVVAAPHALHHLEVLVEEVVALVEVDTEGGELRLQIPGGSAERHPAPGEHVEAEHRLGAEEGVAVRGDVDVGEQPELARGGRGERERDEGIEGVVTAGVEPAGVARRVVGHVHTRETGSFGRGRDLHDCMARHELGGIVDPRGRQFQ